MVALGRQHGREGAQSRQARLRGKRVRRLGLASPGNGIGFCGRRQVGVEALNRRRDVWVVVPLPHLARRATID